MLRVGEEGILGTHPLIDWILLPYREAWPNDWGLVGGNLPGPVQHWKSIEEVQQILRDLGMRQAIYTPVFEGPELATFTAGI